MIFDVQLRFVLVFASSTCGGLVDVYQLAGSRMCHEFNWNLRHALASKFCFISFDVRSHYVQLYLLVTRLSALFYVFSSFFTGSVVSLLTFFYSLWRLLHFPVAGRSLVSCCFQ
jgi:hypothetical protein